MTTKRILIVEDNPSHAKLEKLVLADSGYDIRVANNAEEALAAVKEFQPQLILMDIQLPGMDGLVLTRQIKADSKYRYITIVAITAYGMKGDKEMALEAGCDGYMAKPIDVEKFPREIKDYLEKIGVDSDGGSSS
jgi:two-component system cell cycle response regulator DivK